MHRNATNQKAGRAAPGGFAPGRLPPGHRLGGYELRTLLAVLRRANTICNDYDDAWKAAEIARIESGG